MIPEMKCPLSGAISSQHVQRELTEEQSAAVIIVR